MDGEGLPSELRALGRALEGPPPADPPGDGPRADDPLGDQPRADSAPSENRPPAAGGETMAERVLSRIVGLSGRAAPGGLIREEQWWQALPGLEAGQAPTGRPGRSPDRGRERPPPARRPRP